MFGQKSAVLSAGRKSVSDEVGPKLASIAIKPKSKVGKADHSSNQKIDVALIVFGRDEQGKAHASRFGEDMRDAAMKAAHLMGFVCLAVTKDAMRNLAQGLPEGRVFESGKCFVPFVKEGTCLALEGHAKQFPRDVLELSANQIAELGAPSGRDDAPKDEIKPEDGNGGGENAANDINAATNKSGGDKGGTNSATVNSEDSKSVKSEPSCDWADIQVGTTVLAVDDPDDGWWEAKVTHAHKSGIGMNIITMLTLEWVAYPDEPSFIRRANEVAYFHPAYGQNAPEPNDSGKAS